MGPARAKQTTHPHLRSGMQRWEQPSPQLSTAPSPFPFEGGRAVLASHGLQSQYWAVGELSGPTQTQQRGYLPSAKQDDAGHVQRDKAHPACFGRSSLLCSGMRTTLPRSLHKPHNMDPSEVRFMKARPGLPKGRGIDPPQITLGNTDLITPKGSRPVCPVQGHGLGKEEQDHGE